MGLFDRLKGQSDIRLTPRAAMLLACISMIAADGNIDDDEVAVVQRLDGPHITPDWNLALNAWKRIGNPGQCAELCAGALNKEQRKCVMANLVDIGMADGELAGAEKSLLEAYMSLFNLDHGFVERLVEIISIKNDRSTFQ
jgi:uncharacterized tellurite resistance protein B-like protein